MWSCWESVRKISKNDIFPSSLSQVSIEIKALNYSDQFNITCGPPYLEKKVLTRKTMVTQTRTKDKSNSLLKICHFHYLCYCHFSAFVIRAWWFFQNITALWEKGAVTIKIILGYIVLASEGPRPYRPTHLGVNGLFSGLYLKVTTKK